MTKIPIYFKSLKTLALEDAGIDSDIKKDSITRESVFYSIDALLPFVENEEIKGTSIFAGGGEFISPLSINTIEKLIMESRKQELITII